MEYSIVENNVVTNIVVADAPLGENWHEGNHGIDSTYDPVSGTFTPPTQPELPAPTPPKHITVGRFFDRFQSQKYPILASSNPMVQALIKDCSVRSYIDLDDPQLPYGLQMLVDAGFPVDVQAILTTPLTETEHA